MGKFLWIIHVRNTAPRPAERPRGKNTFTGTPADPALEWEYQYSRQALRPSSLAR